MKPLKKESFHCWDNGTKNIEYIEKDKLKSAYDWAMNEIDGNYQKGENKHEWIEGWDKGLREAKQILQKAFGEALE